MTPKRFYNAQSIPQSMPQYDDVYHAEPARPASIAADVGVPALQALISALIVAGLVYAGARAGFWPSETCFFAGLLALAVIWALLLLDHRRLLWAIETLSNRDLNHDRCIGEPERLLLEVKHTGGERAGGFDFLHLGIAPGTFETWSRAALAGQTLAVNRWVGRGAPFTRQQYEQLMSELERAGIVRLAQSGRELTSAGRAALRACVHVHAADAEHTDAQARE